MIEFGKVVGSISDLIEFLETVRYEYGNDTPIKIIDPIDHRYCGSCKVEGFSTNGSIMLSGLYIFGINDEDINKKANEFVEKHKYEPCGVFDNDTDREVEFASCKSHNDGLKEGYIGCMEEILKNRNV